MTREDIIRIAREAGFAVDVFPDAAWIALMGRFAKLIAAAEQEECAKVCEDMWGKGYLDDNSDQWIGHDNAVKYCANAIRLRGNK